MNLETGRYIIRRDSSLSTADSWTYNKL